MNVSILELISLTVGSGGILSVLFVVFRSGKVVQKIESMSEKVSGMDKRFDKIDERLNKMDEKFASLDKGLGEIRIQLGKLETRVEERTFRVVQTTREIKPDPAHLGTLSLQEEKITRNSPAAI